MRQSVKCIPVVIRVLLVCGLSWFSTFISASAENPVLIGQMTTHPTLALEGVDLPLQIDRAYRSPYQPNTTPLPALLAELPDVVDIRIGYHNNEIPSLADAGLIEPLDGFFERIGVDPEALMASGLLEAVTYKGKIWALPHRAETLVLSYDKRIFEEAGVQPDFGTWEAVFRGLQSVAESDATATGDEATLQIGRMGDDAIALYMLWLSGHSVASWQPAGTGIMELFEQYKDKQVFAWVPYIETMTRVEAFDTIESTENRGLRLLPQRLAKGDPEENRLGEINFLECFALRKNSPENKAVAEQFLQWLMTDEAQMHQVQASRLDYAPHKRSMAGPHVPLYRGAQDHPEFRALAERVPEYAMLVEFVNSATFATPVATSTELRKFIAYRAKKGMGMIPSYGDVPTLQAMCAPRSAEEDQEIAAANEKPKASGGFKDF